MEASHCPFNCWTSSREAVNTNFYSLWFDPTGNRTRVCRFSSRRSIHSTTDRCKRPWPEFSLFLNQFHTVCPKIETKFLGELENSKIFSAQNQEVSKKKKKKVFTEFETNFSAHIGNPNVWGGLFSIFHKKSASKPPKRCDFAYFTSQWGGARARPPPLATLLLWWKGCKAG